MFDFNQLEEYTSKSELCRLLKVSSRTIFNYHQLALSVDDFYEDYPTLGNDTDTTAKLTKYQVWVLTTLITFGQRIAKSKMLKTCHDGSKALKNEVNFSLSKNEFSKYLARQDKQSTAITLVA